MKLFEKLDKSFHLDIPASADFEVGEYKRDHNF